ncbi:MAG: F0F1 ATP synthase subunit delta [Candidatus Saccharibacteria bacterium]|nr:F0F1 ATP synthase subunit delta [Candidatus Saccharibacteria bacterium]
MNEILKRVTTVNERDELTEFLNLLEQKIFNANISIAEFIDDNAPVRFKVAIKEFLLAESAQGQEEKIFSKSKELKNGLVVIPTITLTIANDPTDETVEIVRQYLESTGKPVLVEFTKDKSLIGGAVIENSGRVFEYSLRDYFEKRKETNGL